MNKEQAIIAMNHGHKVRHSYFTNDEWMRCEESTYVFEDGIDCDPSMFWLDRRGPGWEVGWSLVGVDLSNSPDRMVVWPNAESDQAADDEE